MTWLQPSASRDPSWVRPDVQTLESRPLAACQPLSSAQTLNRNRLKWRVLSQFSGQASTYFQKNDFRMPRGIARPLCDTSTSCVFVQMRIGQLTVSQVCSVDPGRGNDPIMTVLTQSWTTAYCQASSPVDATWRQRKRTTKEHSLEKRSGEGDVDSRIQLEGIWRWQHRTELKMQKRWSVRPMFHPERQGLSQVDTIMCERCLPRFTRIAKSRGSMV